MKYGAVVTPLVLGGIEAGGTKFVCVIGSGPDHIVAQTRVATRAPEQTLPQAVAFFTDFVAGGGRLEALGIASFGPLESRPSQPHYGFITTTPKAGWSDTDVVGPLRAALRVPVGFDTDVNGAALGEGRWGAARGLETFVYLTVGTGVGGGAVINGDLARGLVHAEMGHVIVGRAPGDDYPGGCPFHGACLEGMASGPALAERWGGPLEELEGARLSQAVELEATYLADGLRDIIYTIAPERVVIGGGIAALPGLFPRLRAKLAEALASYPGLPEHSTEDFVTPAALGASAGPAGALVLAELAAQRHAQETTEPGVQPA